MSKHTHNPHFSPDAAMVVALAHIALSRAASTEEEVERWVRTLRLHGAVGCAMQSLGVPERPLESTASPPAPRGWCLPTRGDEAVDLVARRAARTAAARGSAVIGTVDVLAALLETYGRVFDRSLYVRGTSRQELLERLAAVDARPRFAA